MDKFGLMKHNHNINPERQILTSELCTCGRGSMMRCYRYHLVEAHLR